MRYSDVQQYISNIGKHFVLFTAALLSYQLWCGGCKEKIYLLIRPDSNLASIEIKTHYGKVAEPNMDKN